MSGIYSIERLTSSQLSVVASRTGEAVKVLDRADFSRCASEHPHIEVLLCRDRDDISGILELCPNLRFLFIVSTGVERLPFQKLLDKNILVCNTGGINCEIMSQYAMGYILAQSVRVLENYSNQLSHTWKKFQCVDSLVGKNLLIVGAGRTGTLIAAKAKAFGMNCVGIKNRVSLLPDFKEIGTLSELDTYLPWADYVVCTLPLTPETTLLFNYRRFCLMKASATFINVARGRHVVEEDLIRALDEHRLKTAVLDVFQEEPLKNDSVIWTTDNLYISPHSSGRLENFMDEAMGYFVNNYIAYKENKELPNQVNLANGY